MKGISRSRWIWYALMVVVFDLLIAILVRGTDESKLYKWTL